MISTARILWGIFGNYRRHVAMLVVLGFLGAFFEGIGINATVPLLSFLLGVQSTPTDLVSNIIERLFVLAHIPFTFRYLIVFIIGLFLLRAAATTSFGYIRGRIGADFFAVESRAMVGHALKASWPYLLKQKLGTLQTVLVRDVQQTSSLLDVITQVIQSFSGFLIYILIAVNMSPTTTLATLAGGAVLLLLVRPFLHRIQNAGNEMTDIEKRFNKFLSEQLIGMKTIKAAGVERAALEHGNGLIDSLRRLQMRVALYKSLSGSLFQPFTVAFIGVVFALSYRLPGFSAVAFIATLYLIQKTFTYLESGQSALHALSQLTPYARSVAEHKKTLAEHREERTPGERPFVFERELSFNRVSLSYIEGEPAVRDVSFVLKRGEMLALIGPSGAGKTTVADLLLRLFEPSSGHIHVDDTATKDISLAEWRQNMGYVSQDVFLFNATVEENIRFYRHNITHADVADAAKKANIYEFIASLPDGFNTIVGDRGVMLSGGQRQRIALARVLAGNPAILVLDEATSALDKESEQAIQEAIANLHGQVSVFVIAHRLSTIESADTIMVVEKGRITEIGSPKELRANPSSYFARHSG